MFRIRRKRNGQLEISLSALEFMVFRTLPDRVRNLLDSSDTMDRVARRLFPVAYEDSDREAEYRRLLGDDLRQRKLEAVEAFEGTLGSVRLGLREVQLTIPPEAFELWLGFINDVRLILGTELGIEDDNWTLSEVDPSLPQADELELLHYLSWLEECLIEAHAREPQPGGAAGPPDADRRRPR